MTSHYYLNVEVKYTKLFVQQRRMSIKMWRLIKCW